MLLSSWFTRWFQPGKRKPLRSRAWNKLHRYYQPTMDLLEDRLAPAVLSGIIGEVVNLGAIQPGFDTNVLARNDDGSSSQISLVHAAGFASPINFFGLGYSSLYVNNNGNLTFNGPQSTFTPFGLTGRTNIPIIAPFFADVWTFGNSGLTKYGFGTVGGHHAFGATWDHVNYYADNASNGTNPGSKQNWFQVLLIDRADTGTGNFDIEFNYNQIQWETGSASGGSGGLGGTSAHAGYSNGSGTANTFFELPGSGINGAFLDNNANGLIHRSASGDNVLGRYVFNVRSGYVTPTISVIESGGVYNGSEYTATATVTGVSGVVPTLTYYTGATAVGTPLAGAPRNVGTYTVVASIAGTETYASASASTTFAITPKALTVTGIAADDKVYDGTTTATLRSGSATLVGVVADDGVSLVTTSAVGNFANPNVGNSKTISITGLTLANNAAGNYVLTQPAGLTANITRATPTVTVQVANGLYNGSPFEATATVVGIDGIPNSTLEEVPVSIAYYEGTSTEGDPLTEAPINPGLYTAVATFAGSSNYDSAQVSATFLIVPIPAVVVSTPEKVATQKPFAGNENGSISTTDNAISAEVFQPETGGTPIVVSLEHFSSVENSSTSSSFGGVTIENTTEGPVRVLAKFDLKAIGVSPGTVIVARFLIPRSADSRTPLALYYDVNPDDSTPGKVVPSSMYRIEDGYFVVTFTDSASVTIYDLTGTVFTITEAANFALPLLALIAPPNQAALSNSNDLLGDLLNSQGAASDGQLIGAVAPTNVSQISAPSGGANSREAEEAERARHWLQILDALYHQLQRILHPQLHFIADKLIVTEPIAFVDESSDTHETLDFATPDEPAFAANEFASTLSSAELSAACAEESASESPSAENDFCFTPDSIAQSSRSDRRVWPWLAVVVGLFWPDMLFSRKKDDRDPSENLSRRR